MSKSKLFFGGIKIFGLGVALGIHIGADLTKNAVRLKLPPMEETPSTIRKDPVPVVITGDTITESPEGEVYRVRSFSPSDKPTYLKEKMGKLK